MSIKRVAELYQEMLDELGVDEPEFMDTKNTPMRVAKMLHNELLAGYRTTEKQLLKQVTCFPAEGMSELVVQTNIPLTSICGHHMLPFTGTAAIGYLPGPKIFGLSKLSRILDHYSARLQIQERLGLQVAEFLINYVQAEAAFVLIRAEHHCMGCRGVKKPHVQTVTATYRPLPPPPHLITEFYSMVAHGESK